MVRSNALDFCCGFYFGKVDGAGIRRYGAINEENRLRVGNIRGEFRRPLLTADHQQAGFIAEAIFSPAGKPWPDAVITAQRIAASEKKASGLGGCHSSMVLSVRLAAQLRG